jgi:hypothetical protein
MLLIIYIAAILLGFFFPKSKICSIFLIGLLVFLFTVSKNHADYSGYLGTYESIINNKSIYTDYFEKFEPAYKSLVKSSVYVGFSYETFLFTISSILFISVYYCILGLTKFPNPVLASYLIYPFLLDIVQLRNFIGECFLFFSLYFLLKNKKYSVVFATISLAIAASFQILFTYYFSILFLLKKRLKYTVTFIAFPITLIVILLKLNFQIPFFDNIIYFKNNSSFFMFICITIIYFLNLIIIFKTINNIEKIKSSNNILNISNILNMGFQLKIINCIIFFSFPLLLFGVDFTRISRNISLLNFAYIFTAAYTRRSRRLIILAILLLLLQLINAWLFYYYIGYDLIFLPILLE